MTFGRKFLFSFVYLAATLIVSGAAQAAAGGAGGRGGYTDANGVYHPPTKGQPGQSDNGTDDRSWSGRMPTPPVGDDSAGWGQGLPGAPGGAPGRAGRPAAVPAQDPEMVDPVAAQFENDKQDAKRYILACINQGYSTESCVRNGMLKLRVPDSCAAPALRPIPGENKRTNTVE